MTKFLTYIFLLFFSFTSSVNAGYSDAINRGNPGAGIFNLKNFGNENTNGMSKTEWIVANADDSRTILSGSGVKVAVNYDMLETSISYAIPIKKEDTMTSKEDISIYLGIKGRI